MQGFPGDTSSQSVSAYLATIMSGQGFSIAGDGFVRVPQSGGATEARWTVPSQWTKQGTTAADGGTIRYSLVSTDQVTATTCASLETCTQFTVYYSNANGNWKYQVDGGGYSAAQPRTGASTITSVTVTGLANTTHTIGILCTGGNGNCIIYGIEFSSASGCSFSNFGCSGATSNSWIDQTNFQNHINLLLAFNPNTVIYMIGYNDPGHYTSAQTQANIVSLRNLVPSSDFFLVLPPPHSTASLVTNMAQNFYNAADQLGVPLLDMNDRWGTFALANTYNLESGSGSHPSPSGYQEIAQAVRKLLT